MKREKKEKKDKEGMERGRFRCLRDGRGRAGFLKPCRDGSEATRATGVGECRVRVAGRGVA